MKKIRACYFGTYRAEYPRNIMMIDSLRRMGVDVIICHEQLWRDIDDRVQIASGGWRKIGFAIRVISTYYKLLSKYIQITDYDILILGYPAHYEVFLAWVLTRLKKKPLCWDILMSIYQVARERRLDRVSPLTLTILKNIERIASRLPDLLFLESEEYIDWYVNIHKLSREKFRQIPMGVDTSKYHPISMVRDNPKFIILYYGSFIPNHGVHIMVEAAHRLMSSTDLLFIFIGIGPEYEYIKKWVEDNHVINVNLLGWVDDNTLIFNINQADICMGVFGQTPQSHMTIQHKILESLAMQKPLITGKSVLMDRVFTHKENIYLCEREVDGLVSGLCELRNDPALRNKIAQNGYYYVTENFSINVIGKLFLQHIQEIIK